MPVTLLPDALAIVAGYLRQHLDVRAFVDSRVYTQSPANPTWPLVRVTQVIETEVVPRVFASTRIQVEAYGVTATDDSTARDLAATCRAALHDLPGWAHPQGWVAHVEEASGVAAVPDNTVDRARYLFDVRVFARVT